MSEVCAEKLAPVSTSMTSAEAMSGYRGAPRLSFAIGSGKLSVQLPFSCRIRTCTAQQAKVTGRAPARPVGSQHSRASGGEGQGPNELKHGILYSAAA